MRPLRCLALAVTQLGFAACSGSPPSDADVLKHVLAIDDCYAQVYAQVYAARTHSLRLCFVATSATQRVDATVERHPAILALGRSCEKYDDTSSDDAIEKYQACILAGMPAALAAKP